MVDEIIWIWRGNNADTKSGKYLLGMERVYVAGSFFVYILYFSWGIKIDGEVSQIIRSS